MNGKIHRIVGLDVALIAAPIISGTMFNHGSEIQEVIVNSLAVAAGSLFGSVYPDCDLPDSFANKRVKLLPGIFAKKDKTTSRTWIDWGEHRGATHGGLFSALWSTLMLMFGLGLVISMIYGIHYLLAPIFQHFDPRDVNSYTPEHIRSVYFSTSRFITYGVFLGGYLLGYISHILLDWIFGTEGVPLFYPFSKKNFGIRIQTSESATRGIEIGLRLLTYIGVIISTLFIATANKPANLFNDFNDKAKKISYTSGPSLEEYEEFLAEGHIAWDINTLAWCDFYDKKHPYYEPTKEELWSGTRNGASSEDYFRKRNEAITNKKTEE